MAYYRKNTVDPKRALLDEAMQLRDCAAETTTPTLRLKLLRLAAELEAKAANYSDVQFKDKYGIGMTAGAAQTDRRPRDGSRPSGLKR